jgi:uncharacterized protein DUF6798
VPSPPWSRSPWLLGIAGILGAWLNAGIDVAGPDQQLYIPYIRHFAHPALYAGDYIFANQNYRSTLYVPLVGTLHRLAGGDLVPLLLAVHLGSLFVLFSGIAAAAARLSRGPAPAWAVAFLTWPPPIPGAAAALWEPTPHPRTLALALAVWSLRHALDARALPAALLAAATFAIHPLAGIAAALAVGLAFTVGVAHDRPARRRLAVYAATTTLLIAATRPLLGGGATLPLAPQTWWLQVATSGFLWSASGNWALLLSLALWATLFILAQPRAGDATADGTTVAATRVVRFGQAFAPLYGLALAGMLTRSPLLVSLQLRRAIAVLILASVLLTARRLTAALAAHRLPLPLYILTAALPLTHSLGPLFAGLLLALAWPHLALPPRAGWAAALALAAVVAFRFRPHREQLTTGGDWIALQRWTALGTAVDARILAPPHTPDFRVFSERASVVGTQDGQPAIFDHPYADEWRRRQPALAGYAAHDCATLTAAARAFDAAYLVTDWPCPLPLAHAEGQWRLYDAKMRQP